MCEWRILLIAMGLLRWEFVMSAKEPLNPMPAALVSVAIISST